VPLTADTSPITKAALGCPLGVGRGVAAARGVPLGAPPGANPPAVHPADDFGERRTLVAVIAPVVASFRPVATTHVPVVMSAKLATDVLANDVLVVKVTVASPLGPVRMPTPGYLTLYIRPHILRVEYCDRADS
jgi:hypothetical protein